MRTRTRSILSSSCGEGGRVRRGRGGREGGRDSEEGEGGRVEVKGGALRLAAGLHRIQVILKTATAAGGL